MKIVHEDEKGRENFFNCDHPVDLLSTLLRKLGGTASVNQLCQVKVSFHCWQITGYYLTVYVTLI